MVFSKLKRNRAISYELAVIAVAGMLALSVLYSAGAIMSVHYANAQQPSSPPPTTSAAGANPPTNATTAGGLKFFIKLANNNTSSSQPQAGSNASSSGGANATKKITINVHVQQGPNGKPATLPITAVVPQNTKLSDLQLCASTGSGQPMCQPLASASGGKSTLDLTKQSPSSGGAAAAPAPPAAAPAPPAAAATTTPSRPYGYHGSTSYNGLLINTIFSTSDSQQPIVDNNRDSFHYLPVQSSLLGDQGLIGSVNIPINIDVTAIVPINVDIQNAQVCAQVAGGSCSQVILNPTQSTYSPTTVSYAQPTPTVTATPTTTTPTTTTTAPQPTSTTTSTQPTTTGTPTTSPSTSTSPSSPTTSSPTTTSPPASTTTPSPSTSSGSDTSSGGSSTGSSGGK
jgi:hypothetical protein